jgi:hypothetical protein
MINGISEEVIYHTIPPSSQPLPRREEFLFIFINKIPQGFLSCKIREF